MYLPGISGITRRLVYSRFAKTLATCYAAGLPITRSVEIAGDTCGNEMVRLNCSRSIPALQSGAKLSEALGAVALLPPMIMQVIVTGETTGRLDETLRRASNIFDKEAESGIKGMIILTGLVSWAVVAVIFAIGIISFWSGYAKGISNLMP
jgi:type II secretory pathway component PulF